jgi:3-hydroxybutyryl-CoA dehydrogenase
MSMAIAGFERVGVVGAGQMGAGIAQVCATFGLDVTLVDLNAAQLEKARATIGKSLDKLVEKGKLAADVKNSALNRLQYSSDLASLSKSDLVIEAIIENESIKRELFTKLDSMLAPTSIIASNTSSIPITRLASYTKRPDRFIGMHFMNPVPLMKLVEIISGMATSAETLQRIQALSKGLEKETTTSQDYPGFVVNRILMPMINEAFYTLMEGVASAEDIDKGMMLGCNMPMGPLALADFIGLDTCLSIMRVIHDGTQDPKHRPSPLLAKYVEAGFMGRKTKRGVFKYD